jgi:tetratricopeptide (TPR) repeat protein
VRPEASLVHYVIGMDFLAIGHFDEAIRHFKQAVDRDPAIGVVHNNLGTALLQTGQLDEAIRHFQESIRIEPAASAGAHCNLGFALGEKGELDEAICYFEKSIRLDPKASATAHNNLGFALREKGQLDEAIGHFQESIRLDPKKSALSHKNLGLALREKGQLDEAIGHFQESIRLDPNLIIARRHLYSCLYTAACSAIRDSVGQGSDETRLGEQERVGLRRQALAWLRAGLELRIQLRQDGELADLQAGSGWSLFGWQSDPALAGVRDGAALPKLPGPEREQWQRLWVDVAALLAADPLDQGLAHTARREWDKAAGSYKRALERGAVDDGHFWFEYAALLLLSGDQQGYAGACAHMLERCGKNRGPRAYHVARACTLAPDAVAEPSLPGRLAEKELQSSAKQFWSLTEQGALAYRADRFQEAVPLFKQSLQVNATPGRAVLNWLWLALANQRLGQAEEARRWLGTATAWLDQFRDGMPASPEAQVGLHLHNWLEANVLRREAEALIRPERKP